MIPVLTNPNNKIKFTGKYSLIASPSTDIPERLPTKDICEISSHIFSYCFIPSVIIKVTIANMKNTTIIARILIIHVLPPVYAIFCLNALS